MPTTRQKTAIKKLVENGGKSVSKAMREAGYSEATAKTPQKLTESKGWLELIEQYIPDEDLTQKHKELLNAKFVTHSPFHYKIKDKEIKELIDQQGFTFIGTKRFMMTAIVYYAMPDSTARFKALEMAYKLKGRFPKGADDTPDTRSLINNILVLVQNGNPRIVTSSPQGVSRSEGDSGEAIRPQVASEQSILDQR